MRTVSPLGLKIFGFSALAITVSLGTALLVVRRVAKSASEASIDRALSATLASIDDKLAARSQTLRATAERLAAEPTYLAGVERALAQADGGTLLDAADELRTRLGAEWVLITDPVGILAAWSDHPERAGIDLSGGALVDLALQGASTEGIWLEPSDRGELIYQAVGVPLRSPGRGTPLGVVVAALPVDSSLAGALRRNTDSEIVFFTRDPTGKPVPNVATLPAGAALAGTLGSDTGATRVSVTEGDDRWVGAVGTLRSAAGTPLAGVVGLRSRGAELAPYLRLERVITIALIGGLVVALAASAWLAGRIVGPVRGLVAATRRVGAGDYSTPVATGSQDEIGELGRAFQRMVHELEEKQRLVDFLGAGRSATPAPESTGAAPAIATPIEVGSVLAGRYRVDAVLGSGGMGVVFRALDRELDEVVAVKTLHPGMKLGDPVLLERFKQEIRLARRITHRNVVRTHDLGESGGTTFITMEYVEGTSLDQLIKRRGQLPVEVAVPILKQVLRALEVAHEVGVIHRDIKPGNVMVQPSGFVKVMDFGIARLSEVPADREALTRAGVIIGSPNYMAPEQLLGEDVDHRVDLYAAGCILFESLTGRRIHQAPNLLALVARHLDRDGPDPGTLIGLPPSIVAIIERALTRDRERRWPTAAAMLDALDAIG